MRLRSFSLGSYCSLRAASLSCIALVLSWIRASSLPILAASSPTSSIWAASSDSAGATGSMSFFFGGWITVMVIGKRTKMLHRRLSKRLSELGYGHVQAAGRSRWGAERSFIVINARKEHLTQLGNEFGQEAVIHVKGNNIAHLHHLDAAPADKTGTSEPIGKKEPPSGQLNRFPRPYV
jgi:hypothetical protein